MSEDLYIANFLAVKRKAQGDEIADAVQIRKNGNAYIVRLPHKNLELGRELRCSKRLLIQMTEDLAGASP